MRQGAPRRRWSMPAQRRRSSIARKMQLKARRQELIARRDQAARGPRSTRPRSATTPPPLARLDEEEAKLRQETADAVGADRRRPRGRRRGRCGGHRARGGVRRRRRRACRGRGGARGARARDARGAGEAPPAGGRADGGAPRARPHRTPSMAAMRSCRMLRRSPQRKRRTAAIARARPRPPKPRSRMRARRSGARGRPTTRRSGISVRSQAEARTLAELLDLEKAKRFSPLIDSLEVDARLREGARRGAWRRSRRAARSSTRRPIGGHARRGDARPRASARRRAARSLRQGSGQPGAPAPPGRRRRGRGCGDIAITSSRPASASSRASGGLWRWDGFTRAAGLRPRRRAPARAAEPRRRRGAGAEVRARGGREGARHLRHRDAGPRRRGAARRRQPRGACGRPARAVDLRRKALAEAERRQSRVAERLSAFAGALARIEADTETCRAELRAARRRARGLARYQPTWRRSATTCRRSSQMTAAARPRRGSKPSARRTKRRCGLRRLADIAAERERWASRRGSGAEERVAELTERLAALDVEIAAVPDDPAHLRGRRSKALEADIEAAEAAAYRGRARPELGRGRASRARRRRRAPRSTRLPRRARRAAATRSA